MKFRKFGSLDWQVSALGFGAMRLPVERGDFFARGPDFGRIVEDEATRMMRTAIDGGVNYVDTAYVYHSEAGEAFVARALREGYRDKVKVATKMPVWKAEKQADFDRLFAEEQERLEMESIDFYLLHSLGKKSWTAARDVGVLQWAERALGDGRIGHFGFSFHDDYDTFVEILEASDLWEFVQIQYNYMDEDYQAGTRGLHLAAERGLGVVVMEPVRGGQLARRPPEAVAAHWAAANERRRKAGLPPRAPVEWALHWVWDHPEVAVVLSGMSTLEQVEQNLAAAAESAPNRLRPDDLETYAAVREAYRGLIPIPCTACRYCLPCPNGVAIPDVFEVYNDAFMYDHARMARLYYSWLEADEKADKCVQCGDCEPKCPQRIGIVGWLEKAQQFLAVEGE